MQAPFTTHQQFSPSISNRELNARVAPEVSKIGKERIQDIFGRFPGLRVVSGDTDSIIIENQKQSQMNPEFVSMFEAMQIVNALIRDANPQKPKGININKSSRDQIAPLSIAIRAHLHAIPFKCVTNAQSTHFLFTNELEQKVGEITILDTSSSS